MTSKYDINPQGRVSNAQPTHELEEITIPLQYFPCLLDTQDPTEESIIYNFYV